MKNDWKGLINNPLGIIGFFLVIVEGMASLVITNSSLPDWLNFYLVFFIVLFPFVVLWVFYILVSKHSDKLYAPKDFRDEKHFIEYTRSKFDSTVIKTIGNSEDINKQVKVKIDYSKTSVIVNEYIEKGLEIRKELKNKGVFTESFIPEIEYETDLSIGPAIWLRRNLAYEKAIEIIRVCKEIDDKIEYIYFQDAFENDMFIGANAPSFHLPLGNTDFDRLFEISSQKDFFDFITLYEIKKAD